MKLNSIKKVFDFKKNMKSMIKIHFEFKNNSVKYSKSRLLVNLGYILQIGSYISSIIIFMIITVFSMSKYALAFILQSILIFEKRNNRINSINFRKYIIFLTIKSYINYL